MLRGKWWEVYQDPKLNELEERIDTYNQSVHQALETYMAAQEQVRSARADFYPTLSAGPNVSHNKLSEHRPFSNGTSGSSEYNDLQLAGQASWEPDFWGQIRRNVEGAKAGAQASAADMANVGLSLHALMAEDYLEMRGLDLQSQVLQAAVKDLTGRLELTRRLRAGGIGTDADVAEALTQLETTRAQMIDVGVARAQFEHAVGSIADIKLPNFSLPPTPLDLALPRIPLGIPSQLLERRPDIAAAERRAAQANAQIGIAIAAFYPTITLSGSGGFESTHGGTWIQGPSALWSLGAQAAELILDGGRRKAVTNQARDLFEASASNYKGVVFLAFNEVEDKLSNLRILEQEEQTELGAVAAAQHSLDISQIRYKGGVTSYLEVLTAENALIQNQVTEATLKSRQFAASVELIKALGGGWDTTQLPK
jgi:NodT family efflux transporter outer membrane factor (OMF) lipoprotein